MKSRPPKQPNAPPAHVERTGAWVAVASVLLLIPCFWQSRLQMSDLESHIYNSWLAQLIESGRAAGLAIVPQKTNVLFDWILTALFRSFGAGPAQRISVALSVLILAWGAFAFAASVSGRRPWELLPLISILAYGWTLHMGFMNFYLSLGLCLWAVAAAWNWTARGFLMAAPLFAIAVVAHSLPVAWAASMLAYAWLWRRTPIPHRSKLPLGALAAVAFGTAILRSAMPTLWVSRQFMNALGIDQSMVFGEWYEYVEVGLVVCCAVLLFQLVWQLGWRRAFESLPLQIWLVTVIVVLLVPNRLSVPGYKTSLMYVADRMSLAAGICLCALLASAPARRVAVWGIAAATLLFFSFLYYDDRSLNQTEDRMEALVRQLPPYQRVIGGMMDPRLRIDVLTHMIDRICVGRCYSYANYEPSTDAFRIRITAPNGIVAATYEDSFHLQLGGYVVKQREAPLYQIGLNAAGELEIRTLGAGSVVQVAFTETL